MTSVREKEYPAKTTEAEAVDVTLASLSAEVRGARALTLDSARARAVEYQERRGRLTARERIRLLVDPGSFQEVAGLARASRGSPLMADADTPADGVVVGSANVASRPIVVVSYDFTVLGGSMGLINDEKFSRARELSIRNGVPLVLLLEGGGARINERMGSASIRGHERFADLGRLSGWAPIISGVMGPSFAGHANLVALSDFTVMLKGSAVGLAGPRLVEAATGEKVSQEELGGSALHARTLGSVELEVETEVELIEAIKRYLSYMPDNASMPVPRKDSTTTADSDRLPESVYDLVPARLERAYDMRKLVAMIADSDSVFELKPTFARNVITALARIDGHVVGIIANNPMFIAGVLDAKASNKMARFINLCDCYGISIVMLCDTPGYLVGSSSEREGIARTSMRPLWELAQATIPIATIVIRKAYGLAFHTMGGAEFHPYLHVCWPSARVSPMGASGAVNIAFPEGPNNSAEDRAQILKSFLDAEHPMKAAEAGKIDDIIDPRETRQVLKTALGLVMSRPHPPVRWLPPKKRAISPT